jgi:ketosteroid isomerase-like protein
MSTNLERAQAFYGILLSDTEKAAKAYMSADCELENPLPAPMPFGGVYRGHQGFVDYAMKIMETIEFKRFDLLEWSDGGSVVTVRGFEESLVKATGRIYGMRWVHWLNFDAEGRITHMREYNDTAEMLKAFEGFEAG